jgi:hypothetical protein
LFENRGHIKVQALRRHRYGSDRSLWHEITPATIAANILYPPELVDSICGPLPTYTPKPRTYKEDSDIIWGLDGE